MLEWAAILPDDGSVPDISLRLLLSDYQRLRAAHPEGDRDTGKRSAEWQAGFMAAQSAYLPPGVSRAQTNAPAQPTVLPDPARKP